MCTKYWSKSLKGRDQLEDLGVCRWEDYIRMDLRGIGWERYRLEASGSG
jgi:hypothetical protein